MKKIVKVKVTGMPITCISTPLTAGTYGPMSMDVKEIFKCIVSGGEVKEVSPLGVETILTLSNYNVELEAPEVVVPPIEFPVVPPVEAPEEVVPPVEEVPEVVVPPVEVPEVVETPVEVNSNKSNWTAPVKNNKK